MKKTTQLKSIILLFCVFTFTMINAQNLQTSKKLTHHLTPEEQLRKHEIGRNFVTTPPPTGNPISIAEFERSAGVLVAYPFGIPVSLIAEMSKDAKVYTLIPSSSQENTVRNIYAQNNVNLANCIFYVAPTDSYWTRDYGPWFISYGDDKIGIVDFPYNRPRPYDDEVPKVVANKLGISCFGMNVVQTGGNYMTDGYGIGASTQIAYTENGNISNTEVDNRMRQYLGTTKYHVVDDPNNTYIDHIDCWGKFLAPDKVLIRAVPASHPQYSEIEATANYFATALSGYGRPYKVYRVNTPQNQPYTNSFILNNKVFVPITGSSSDNAALQTYRDAMPGYQIFGITQNPSTPWESTDALHCRTHEMADLGWLRIKHIPFDGSIANNTNLTLTAEVTPHSGQEVYPDSVLCYFRVNASAFDEYQHVVMTKTTGNTYTTTLTNVPNGYKVEYYLYAADKSGRREYHPFIGKPDPHTFWKGQLQTPQAALNQTNMLCDVEQGSTITKSVTLSNNGGANLNYTTHMELLDAPSSNWLSISDLNGTINANSNDNIEITCNGNNLEVGVYDANVYFITNDPANDTLKVEVKMNVTINSSVTSFENVNAKIKAIPNPFKDNLQLNFTVENRENYSIFIYNSIGKLVYSTSPQEYTTGNYDANIDTSSFAPGLYLIILRSQAGSETIKAIKY